MHYFSANFEMEKLFSRIIFGLEKVNCDGYVFCKVAWYHDKENVTFTRSSPISITKSIRGILVLR